MDSKSTSFLAVLLLTAMAGSGCQLMHSNSLSKFPVASAAHPVVEIMGVWQAAEGTGLDGLPCRGFAGQLMFFSVGQASPVRIAGKVRIYLFDDQGTPEEQEQPIHQYNFDGDAFEAFLTETNIGAAYQLFIPYTRPGSHRATCTLRVRFTPDEGARVYSKMTTVLLPGVTPRRPDLPIQEEKASVMDLTTMLEQAQGVQSPSVAAAPITAAAAAAPTPQHMDDKKLLRSKLNEISRVTTASHEAESSAGQRVTPASHEEVETVPPVARSLKMHPLLEPNAGTAKLPNSNPLADEAEQVSSTHPPTEAAAPAETAIASPDPTSPEATEAKAEPAQPATASAASAHPLFDAE